MVGPADPRAGYDASADPYCYKGTIVLKNIPGLQDQAALEQFETVAVLQRSDEPLPSGRFTVSHYCAIHRHLFQDVYRWAGRFRHVRISKGNSMFCYPENIAPEMRKLFARLDRGRHLQDLAAAAFAAQAAHFLAELNAIHPFREGNGRSQMAFLTLLAASLGHPFALERIDPEQFLGAMVRSFDGDEGPLGSRILALIG